ncbi:unnamed protein product, partial [Mesorhabditis spiculigera]
MSDSKQCNKRDCDHSPCGQEPCQKEEVLGTKPGAVYGWLITDSDEQPIRLQIGRDKVTGDEVAMDTAGNCHNARTGECVPKENICDYS